MSKIDNDQENEIPIHLNPHHDYKISPNGISRIMTTNSHVMMGEITFERGEFFRAFEGYLNPGLTRAPSRKFGNPVPIGVASFAMTLFCVSLVNISARGVTSPAGFAGLMLFYAGFIELLSGMWCFVMEATWAATLLSSFAGFWIGYGCIAIDVFGVVSAYTKQGRGTYNDFLGFWILAWAIFTFMMWLTTLRSTWPMCIMVLLVVLTLIMLSASEFTAAVAPVTSVHLKHAGGYFGLITSVIAWFVLYEGLCTPENSYWVPPVLLMPGAITKVTKED
jgi:succinate-acetate transporter protein